MFFSILVILSTSCKDKKTKKKLPFDRQTMINVLADVEVAEEVVKYYIKDADSAMVVYMDSIYKIHNIDSNIYNNTIGFLENNIDIYYEIEQEVHAKLKDMQEDFNVQDTIPKKSR